MRRDSAVPMRLRPRYMADWCPRLERAYRPQPYGGDVLLICTPAAGQDCQQRRILVSHWMIEFTNYAVTARKG